MKYIRSFKDFYKLLKKDEPQYGERYTIEFVVKQPLSKEIIERGLCERIDGYHLKNCKLKTLKRIYNDCVDAIFCHLKEDCKIR